MNISRIIIGAGRQALETYYLLRDITGKDEIDAFAIDHPEPDQEFLGKKVYGTRELVNMYSSQTKKPGVLVAIGGLQVNKRLVALFKENNFSFFSAISPEVKLERQRFVGEGTTIAQGCVITCNVSIGNYVLINVGCTISHDCIIGNNVIISPGCHVAGAVDIEDDVFIGIGASFIPQVRVGKGSVIAAGACVTRDIPPYSMAAGVPAVVKKQINL
jgi:sugar O-acyltransferase (sialic acid O-acetyltransferase NeuD family)